MEILLSGYKAPGPVLWIISRLLNPENLDFDFIVHPLTENRL